MQAYGGYVRAVFIHHISPSRLVNPVLGAVVVGSTAWARSSGEWLILIGGAVSAVAYLIKTVLRPLWKKLDEIVDHTEQVPAIKAAQDELATKLDAHMAETHAQLAAANAKITEITRVTTTTTTEALPSGRDPASRTRSDDRPRWETP